MELRYPKFKRTYSICHLSSQNALQFHNFSTLQNNKFTKKYFIDEKVCMFMAFVVDFQYQKKLKRKYYMMQICINITEREKKI